MNEQATTSDIRVTDEIDQAVTGHAHKLMDRALDPVEHDDRFDEWPSGAEPSTIVALATDQATPAGQTTAIVGRDRLQLDVLVARDHPEPATLATAMMSRLTPWLPVHTIETVELWGRPARAWHQAVAEAEGMTELRALHQMRCTLPVDVEPLPTRGFRPSDLEAVRAVNNRAFASHPDQGHQTTEEFQAAMASPWFRAEGLRVYERDGRVAGFCWTKIHPARDETGPLGEIYVIGVDPDFHGQGLGAPMTAAGLRWLVEQGLTTGMLYVEADNVPAIRTYERLGFTTVRTDRAWWRTTIEENAGP